MLCYNRYPIHVLWFCTHFRTTAQPATKKVHTAVNRDVDTDKKQKSSLQFPTQNPSKRAGDKNNRYGAILIHPCGIQVVPWYKHTDIVRRLCYISLTVQFFMTVMVITTTD